MALRKRINPRSVLNPDTGFGADPSSYGGRFVNKDGSYNIVRKGTQIRYRVSVFHQSPLQNFTLKGLEHGQAELFVQITGFDEVFSATVVRKTSYFYNEILYGANSGPCTTKSAIIPLPCRM